jgi:hypothetical protein
LPNIVKLSDRAAQHLQTGNLATDELCFQLVNRVMELRTRAQGELQRVIGFLDLSLSTIRKIVDQISDPGVRKTIEDQIVSIETRLKLAHEKALDL